MNTGNGEEMKRMAWENYRHVQLEAERRYDTTLSRAKNKCEQEIEQARTKYDASKRDAQELYNTEVAEARDDYEKTVAMVSGQFRRHTTQFLNRETAGSL